MSFLRTQQTDCDSRLQDPKHFFFVSFYITLLHFSCFKATNRMRSISFSDAQVYKKVNTESDCLVEAYLTNIALIVTVAVNNTKSM